MSYPRLALAVLSSALVLTFVAACGGGGGGGGGPTAPPPPQTGITFTANGSTGANTVTLAQGGGTTGTTLVLEVRANQVAGLFGLAFELTYPSSVLAFTTATEGTVLSNGAPTSFQALESSPGNLVVGLTRLGTGAGLDANGVLLTLTFSAPGAGNGPFTFRRNQGVGTDGLGLIALAWGGGSVQVTR